MNAMIAPPLVIVRHFKASPERVFSAFLDRETLQGWFGPMTMTVPSCATDPRVGGRYRVEMHSPAGTVHTVVGEYKEIAPPERLVFTWAWLKGAGLTNQSLVTIAFKPKDGGTELTLEHTGLATEEIRTGHARGWEGGLDSLASALDGRTKATDAAPIVIGVPRSSNVQRVLIAFHEKGVACRVEPVRPRTPEVLAVNPFGKIPVLKCGDLTLYESAAIMRYVDEAFDGPALMPEAPAARARVQQWLGVLDCYAHPSFIRDYVLQYFLPRGADGKPDRMAIEASLPEIARILDVLEAAYGERDWLVGETPSLADFALAPMIFNLAAFPEGKAMVAERANVARAHRVFAERPSFKSAMASALK